MQKRVSREAILYVGTLLCLSLLVGGVLLTSTSAHAANRITNPLSLPTSCAQTYVHLNGTQPPTIKCVVPGHLVAGRMLPLISSTNVRPNSHDVLCSIEAGSMTIKSLTLGDICFDGTGYTGTSISKVYEVDGYHTLAISSGWVLYYVNGHPGTKWYYSDAATYTCSNSPFCGSTLITQVYINIGL